MNTKKNSLPIFFASLILASLACTISVGGPDYPADPVPFSENDVINLKTQIEQAMLVGAETGTVNLQITEVQLTSYLIQKMGEQANPPFTDPQVLLRDNQMQILGKIQSGIFTANMSIVLDVTIDENGQPQIDIASAEFGPVPLPSGLKEAAGSAIDEAFTGSLGPVATGFRLETIAIADGLMTLTGRTK